MVAVSSSFSPGYPIALGTQLPPGATLPMQAAAIAIGYMQLATLDASGNAALNDGTVPGLVCAGVGLDKLGDTNAVAGIAKTNAWWGMVGLPFSTLSGDGFTAADLGGVPCFIATEGTVGRKSNVSGSNRSLAGVCFGLNDDGLARCWVGPIAVAIARTMLLGLNFPLATHGVADAAASTAIAERSVSHRPKIKGTITDVTYTGSALVVGDTDYVTVSIAKRDGAGGGAVVLATYDSRAAGNGAATAFVPKAFTLSVVAGALFLLETDVVTITTVKGGAGQVLTGEFLVNGKAL